MSTRNKDIVIGSVLIILIVYVVFGIGYAITLSDEPRGDSSLYAQEYER